MVTTTGTQIGTDQIAHTTSGIGYGGSIIALAAGGYQAKLRSRIFGIAYDRTFDDFGCAMAYLDAGLARCHSDLDGLGLSLTDRFDLERAIALGQRGPVSSEGR